MASYQRFKAREIARLDGDWTLTSQDIDRVVVELEADEL
jgi:hypothetical protein